MAVTAAPSELSVPVAAPSVRYVGLASRGIAAVLDAAVINLVAVLAGIGASLILSLLHLPGTFKAILEGVAAAAYILWTVGYFIVFWSTTGQTPGGRVMQFRVVTEDGFSLKPTRALIRCAGVVLAAIPLFAGFALILVDDRRRGLQDYLARTVVIDAPETSYIATRRATRQVAYRASRLPGQPPRE